MSAPHGQIFLCRKTLWFFLQGQIWKKHYNLKILPAQYYDHKIFQLIFATHTWDIFCKRFEHLGPYLLTYDDHALHTEINLN